MEEHQPSEKTISDESHKRLEENLKRFEEMEDLWWDMWRWQRAFPSPTRWTDFKRTRALTYEETMEEDKKKKEDFDLAKEKCPRLYVDPRLFALERAVLARHLGIDGIRCPRDYEGIITKYGERLLPRHFDQAVEAVFNFFASSVFEYPYSPFSSPFRDKEAELTLEKFAREGGKGGNLWLLSHLQQILEKNRAELTRLKEKQNSGEADTQRLQSLEEMESLYSELRLPELSIKGAIKKLFEGISPTEFSPTCIVKYHVVRHPKDDNLRCIQYFFYWPIQVFPRHFLDYEPVFVYVYKLKDGRYATLLVLFNAVPRWATLKTVFRSLFWKRPGHLIRMFFNRTLIFVGDKSLEYLDRKIQLWNREDPKELEEFHANWEEYNAKHNAKLQALNAESEASDAALRASLADLETSSLADFEAFEKRLSDLKRDSDKRQADLEAEIEEASRFDFGEYSELGEFMTKAYSGQYVYEKEPPRSSESAVRRLIDKDRYLAFCIPVKWHSFDQLPPKIPEDWVVIDCSENLIPLGQGDLLHIEWNVYQPFQAPFLYPLVGGKNPLMHFPLDALDFAESSPDHRHWRDFCHNQWEWEEDPKVNDYRFAKLIEFLYANEGKNPKVANDLWEKI